MSRAIRSWLVSELTSDAAKELSERTATATYVSQQVKDFAGEVNKALRGVSFHYHSPSTIIVYRPGEIHALGEIGYKNTKSRGSADPTYYVAARGIINDKYRDSNWQHHIATSKSLKTAVVLAARHLKPFTCEESAADTADTARTIVSTTRTNKLSPVRSAYKDLFGATGYNDAFSHEIVTELRGHVFVSPVLNEASARFYSCLDEWLEAEDVGSAGMYYVGLSDNGEQQIIDTAHVSFAWPLNITGHHRGLYEHAPDWVKGRVAVLTMVEPKAYVQGVGLRLDDRVFYILGDKS